MQYPKQTVKLDVDPKKIIPDPQHWLKMRFFYILFQDSEMLEVLIGEESDDSDFEVEKHKGRPNKIITRVCKNPTRNTVVN